VNLSDDKDSTVATIIQGSLL